MNYHFHVVPHIPPIQKMYKTLGLAGCAHTLGAFKHRSVCTTAEDEHFVYGAFKEKDEDFVNGAERVKCYLKQF